MARPPAAAIGAMARPPPLLLILRRQHGILLGFLLHLRERRRHRRGSGRQKDGASLSMMKARKDQRSRLKRLHRDRERRRSLSDDDNYRWSDPPLALAL